MTDHLSNVAVKSYSEKIDKSNSIGKETTRFKEGFIIL